MKDEIQHIIPASLPFGLDDKIFSDTDEEGNIIGPDYSYNDFIERIKMISGVSEDLMGKA